MGDEIGSGFAIYDVTASAQYPVYSPVTIQASPNASEYTSPEDDLTLTLSQGSSENSGSNLEVSPDGHIVYGFGWNTIDFTEPPVIPGTVTATVSPTQDSTYGYRIGNVKVRNFPTLANIPSTLYVGTQSSFLVSNEVIPGLEISSSNTAIDVCRLETQTNGSVNAVLNSSRITFLQIYLKRGGRTLCSGSITWAVPEKDKLEVFYKNSGISVGSAPTILNMADGEFQPNGAYRYAFIFENPGEHKWMVRIVDSDGLSLNSPNIYIVPGSGMNPGSDGFSTDRNGTFYIEIKPTSGGETIVDRFLTFNTVSPDILEVPRDSQILSDIIDQK